MTVSEIKDMMAVEFMRNEDAAARYGFTVGDNFSAHFSSASIESILFYVFAFASWVIYRFFEEHKRYVDSRIDEMKPSRPKWYRDLVLQFMDGYELIPDTDRYDTSGMTDEQIEAARVVKHAVASDNEDSSILTIKVAGEQGGRRGKLPDDVATRLFKYIEEIEEAGVRFVLVNQDGDRFNCEVDIYYNAMLAPDVVKANCEQAIAQYIENLPFNGEYTNMALIDQLQAVEGVRVPELRNAEYASGQSSVMTPINARCVPEAGYFQAGNLILNMYVYE